MRAVGGDLSLSLGDRQGKFSQITVSLKSPAPISARFSLNLMVVLGNLLQSGSPTLTGKAQQEGELLLTGGFGAFGKSLPFYMVLK